MRKRRLIDPLRRPLFRRLATTYAVNELGDWMGIIALSVLVFDRTDSALATAGLFLGTRFLPALLAPILVARAEKPPPRFALPVIYCGEAAAFGGLALLASNFSLAGVIALATIDGALALTGRSLTRAVVAARARADGRAARRQRHAQRRLHRRRRDRPRPRRPDRRRLRRADGAAARRRLLLRDRLHPADRRADATGRARRGADARPGHAPASPTSAKRRRCAGC